MYFMVDAYKKNENLTNWFNEFYKIDNEDS